LDLSMATLSNVTSSSSDVGPKSSKLSSWSWTSPLVEDKSSRFAKPGAEEDTGVEAAGPEDTDVEATDDGVLGV
jgi:hypothetical protein